MTLTTTDTPRIYVASLSDYNAGRLHGVWIELDGDTTADEIHEATAAMLATGAPGAEEWAIHDHDGFGGLHLSEWEDFTRIAALAHGIDEHGADVVSAFVGNDPDADLDRIDEAFRGRWASVADYVFEFHTDCGTELGALDSYIDWERVGRDWELGGDIWTARGADGDLLIFDSNY